MRDRIVVGGALAAAAAALAPSLGLASFRRPDPVHRDPAAAAPQKTRPNDKREKRKAAKAARAITKRKGR